MSQHQQGGEAAMLCLGLVNVGGMGELDVH